MPRPVKLRKVEYEYNNKYFAPCSKGNCRQSDEVQLNIEELEAMRLKDIQKYTQEECAGKMNVSRQTFQNILDRARQKVTAALIEERAIAVGGGNYTKNICSLVCRSCGNEMLAPFEQQDKKCRHCGSENVACQKEECNTQAGCELSIR
ncbi:RNA polymerase sigma factor, region 3/4 [Acididesulfobacillus acetoxydans]|uniref:UPF0251 protein DEACI_1019 n=1 Tax=Acididesulfobacillus acetoxydans TaxID=1561005 RepID=A0A8S0XAV5_9FIRM|nr:DUF134 domain-containing protein [Acididesulfobacillus acetoxydans]CAA7600436.1 RNA polymerase sigma factor, region 3/4 [Acididesulfobacillus acetoxydans]CEJ06570.1 UPF0251 protein CLK 0815 [Acididesulfobacillus acetoxydans]